ncbi:MAG TPA: RagB/SusD family nutrient uptake outer membrane protein [Chitinophagaceae bacterium]|nr:RagB/SusD family nutrient uptake outer membrane protein [Chitinophagaceae bacterium]
MKKQIIRIFALLNVTLACSCSKSFLNVPIQGQSSPANDPQLATNLVTGVYSSLIYIDPGGGWNTDTHGISFIAATNIMSDDADKGSFAGDQPEIGDLDNFTETPSNTFVAALWNGYYAGISRANNALAALAISPLDTATKTELSAEVRFIRGYYYFNLVRFFGGVPLVLGVPTGPRQADTDPSLVTRASDSDIYNKAIVPDLQFAMDHLPLRSAQVVGRITKGAAETLLAKVYLYEKNWLQAFNLSQDVINSAQYQLVPDYSTIWRQVGDNDAESIFEIETGGYGNTDAGVPLYSECQGPRNKGGVWNNPNFNDPTGDLGWGFCTPSQSLVNAYEPGDLRKAATIITINPNPLAPSGDTLWDGFVIPNINSTQSPYYNYKAYHSERKDGIETFYGNRDRKEKNIHILRYAEVLLINAESANELNNSSVAIADLNQVRNRAGLPNTTASGQTALRTAIWHERHVELALEHDRFFDIVREGRAAQVMQAVGKNFVQGKNEVLPIPATQIALSGGKLIQNPGY